MLRRTKRGSHEFKRAIPLAVIRSDELQRELLSARIDDPALPVSIFTEGTFFPLWDSLKDLVGELRGTRVNPIAALNKQLAAASTLEGKRRYAEGAAQLEAALDELEAAALREDDGKMLVADARTLAGYCRFKVGDLDAAERHYTVAAKHGGINAAQNLVLMAFQDRKDIALTAERVEAFWDNHCFTQVASLFVYRYRALVHAMQGRIAEARAALQSIEDICFKRDDFGKRIRELLELLDDAGPPGGPAAAGAVEALRVEARARVEAWQESRRPRLDVSPREWWSSLDAVDRIILKANLKTRRNEHDTSIDYDPGKAEATDDELQAILQLRSFRMFSVRQESTDGGLDHYARLQTLAPLARLSALTSVDLSDAMAPYSLEPLARLSALRTLNLAKTEVTDLAPLAGLPIEELDLKGTEVPSLRRSRSCRSCGSSPCGVARSKTSRRCPCAWASRSCGLATWRRGRCRPCRSSRISRRPCFSTRGSAART